MLKHPFYLNSIGEWSKWRAAYEGGHSFVNTYLTQYSKREDNDDFSARKAISYCPAFAKSGINEIKDAIFQRMADITRTEGDITYEQAILGLNGGVDRCGSTMNRFMGEATLRELLVMAQVGVYVDAPEKNGETLKDTKGQQPYLYHYVREQILNYTYNNDYVLDKVILQEDQYKYEGGFPIGVYQQYRRLSLVNDGVLVEILVDGNTVVESYTLNLSKIPLVLFEISHSLMSDIADYQIALTNLASSDLGFLLKANFPFYTEQYSALAEAAAGKPPEQEIKVGNTVGRKYPTGSERPGFIAPPSEPIRVSMEKQKQMQDEIRQLIKLSLSTVQTKSASAETKAFDERGLEAGLSNIGLTLEQGERQIAEIWAEYRGEKKAATVKYPENYSLKTIEDRIKESEGLEKRASRIPSLTFKKESSKKVVRIILGNSLSYDTLKSIDAEIDKVTTISDPDYTNADVEAGFLDLESAAESKAYPEDTVEKAANQHADRLKRISESQAPSDGEARGLGDQDTGNGSARNEKKDSQDSTINPDAARRVRGEAK